MLFKWRCSEVKKYPMLFKEKRFRGGGARNTLQRKEVQRCRNTECSSSEGIQRQRSMAALQTKRIKAVQAAIDGIDHFKSTMTLVNHHRILQGPFTPRSEVPINARNAATAERRISENVATSGKWTDAAERLEHHPLQQL